LCCHNPHYRDADAVVRMLDCRYSAERGDLAELRRLSDAGNAIARDQLADLTSE
jgi:hypothetical protein